VLDQLVVSLDRSQRALGVPCNLGQERLAGGLVLPVAVRLYARARIVEAKPRGEPLGGPFVARPDRVEQPSDPRADQGRSVLDRGGAEHRRRVDDPLRLPLEQAELRGQLERALEHEPLLAVEQQPGAKTHQARRMKARVVDRQIERHPPAQSEAKRLHRPLSREPVTVGQQQHLGEQARRNHGAATALRIALREVLVADDPIPVLGEQRVDRVLRQQVGAPRRVKQAPLSIRHRKHPLHLPKTVGLQGKLRIGPDGTRLSDDRFFQRSPTVPEARR
jgi:hypothetical protein